MALEYVAGGLGHWKSMQDHGNLAAFSREALIRLFLHHVRLTPFAPYILPSGEGDHLMMKKRLAKGQTRSSAALCTTIGTP
jgi:hypothetical protein